MSPRARVDMRGGAALENLRTLGGPSSARGRERDVLSAPGSASRRKRRSPASCRRLLSSGIPRKTVRSGPQTSRPDRHAWCGGSARPALIMNGAPQLVLALASPTNRARATSAAIDGYRSRTRSPRWRPPSHASGTRRKTARLRRIECARTTSPPRAGGFVLFGIRGEQRPANDCVTRALAPIASGRGAGPR